MSRMSRRPPNELESKLHQAALSTPNKELSDKQAVSIVPDASQRQAALNFLLGVGLFKTLVNAKGSVSFRAVTKTELAATKDLSGEEKIVLTLIKDSDDKGVWTKQLKLKSNLPKVVMDRCLKALETKRIIKRISSIQFPTRKIYMLEGLEPSVSVTGGPWYTDNELDTEFIQQLSEACLKFIRDISFPKRRKEGANESLFALSNSPDYPSAEQILNSLRRARLTQTDLTVEHVEMLLNVLVLDGEIERLPSFGTAMWNTGPDDDESTDESDAPPKKKRRGNSSRSKGKHKAPRDSDNDTDSDVPSRKKSKKKSHRNVTESDEDSQGLHKKSKKKRKRNDPDPSSSEDEGRKRRSKKRKSRKSRQSSSDESSSSEDNSRRIKPSKATKRSPALFEDWDEVDHSAFVFRAIRQERSTVRQSEAPCSQCPSFDFCKDGGPVNPQGCVYYGDWLTSGTVNVKDIEM